MNKSWYTPILCWVLFTVFLSNTVKANLDYVQFEGDSVAFSSWQVDCSNCLSTKAAESLLSASLNNQKVVPRKVLQGLINSLWKQQIWHDIQVSVDNEQLTFKLVPRFKIGKILITGHKNLKLLQISDEIKHLKKGQYFKDSDANADKEQILTLYKTNKYYNCKIDIEKKPNYSTESVDITFKVTENSTLQVGLVTLKGNYFFTSDQLIALIETKPQTLLSGIISTPGYDHSKVLTDAERIKYFYKSSGYWDTEVDVQPIFTPDFSRVDLIFSIKEGARSIWGGFDLQIEGNILPPGQSLDQLKDQFPIKTGAYFTGMQEKVLGYKEKLQGIYGRAGYAKVDIVLADKSAGESSVSATGNKQIRLQMQITPGKIYTIRKIYFFGLFADKESIARNHFGIKEGSRFDSQEIEDGLNRLRATRWYEDKIEYKQQDVPGSQELIDLQITLVESKSRISISGGLTFDPYSWVGLMGNLVLSNIGGTGVNGSLSAQVSKAVQVIQTNFSYYRIGGSPVGMVARLYMQTIFNPAGALRSFGGQKTVYWNITDRLAVGAIYTLNYKIPMRETGVPLNYLWPQDPYWESDVNFFAGYENRFFNPNIFDPRWYVGVKIQGGFAPKLLGSTFNLASFLSTVDIKKMLASRWDVEFSSVIKVVMGIQDTIPLSARLFNMQEMWSVRPFTLGPMVMAPNSTEPNAPLSPQIIGSNVLWSARVALNFNLFPPGGLKLGVFFETGSGYNTDTKYCGLGRVDVTRDPCRWSYPLVGAGFFVSMTQLLQGIRLGVGFPLNGPEKSTPNFFISSSL